MKVAELMSRRVISVKPDDTVSQAARLMARYDLGSLPVTNGDVLRGIVTDRDIVTRCLAAGEDAASTPVRQVMTKRIWAVSATEDAGKAAEIMAHRQVRRLPVTGGEGTVVGMVSLSDMARNPATGQSAARAFSDISENIRRMY